MEKKFTYDPYKIIQIIPTDGNWYVVSYHHNGSITNERVGCFALVEEKNGFQMILPCTSFESASLLYDPRVNIDENISLIYFDKPPEDVIVN